MLSGTADGNTSGALGWGPCPGCVLGFPFARLCNAAVMGTCANRGGRHIEGGAGSEDLLDELNPRDF